MNGNDQENESPEQGPDVVSAGNEPAAEAPAEENTNTAIDEQPFVAKLVDSGASSESVSAAEETSPSERDDIPEEDSAPEESEHSQPDPAVRVGSPFRKEPPPKRAVAISYASGEAAYGEFGPFRYVAMGAATSTVLVLAFAGMGAWWFPFGGAIVAVLGSMLAILGLFATFRLRLLSLGCLLGHLGLFFLSYVRSLT